METVGNFRNFAKPLETLETLETLGTAGNFRKFLGLWKLCDFLEPVGKLWGLWKLGGEGTWVVLGLGLGPEALSQNPEASPQIPEACPDLKDQIVEPGAILWGAIVWPTYEPMWAHMVPCGPACPT